MRRAKLLAALLLLLLLLAAHHAAADFPVQVYDAKTVYPWQNDQHVSLSASGGGGGELEGGYGAVIKAEVAPLVGAPMWGASSGSVTVWVEDVSYTVTVKVFYINPSTGLGEWRDFASAAGTTYTQAQWVFTGYAPIRPVEYWKVHEWTLPTSGDYPARVRVDFSMSACAEFKELVGLLDSKADEEGLKDALDVVSSKGVERGRVAVPTFLKPFSARMPSALKVCMFSPTGMVR